MAGNNAPGTYCHEQCSARQERIFSPNGQLNDEVSMTARTGTHRQASCQQDIESSANHDTT
jgi:hypothetical protein